MNTTDRSFPSCNSFKCGVLSRRQFLRTTAAAGLVAPLVLPSGLRAASPNSKLNHACIGVGGMGAGDLQQFLNHPRTQVVAVCDVDGNSLAGAAKAAPGARTYSDWRELLAKEGDKIDSVNVTVPDHSHFAIAYSAVQKGKHVYCQKPMCHDVAEVRALTQASIRKGVVTQLGTQMASLSGDRATVHALRSGVIGKIKHAYLHANRPGAVEAYRPVGPRPPGGQPPPGHLNWDLWIATAPMRPFVPDIYHPVRWRGWLDFGTGWSGDIGCHIFDAVWKGLSMKPPLAVAAEAQESWKNSPARRADTWPQANHVTWTFPGNELTEKEWTVEWFDGDFYAPKEVRSRYQGENYPTESAMIVGSEGAMLQPSGSQPILLPQDKFKNSPREKFPDRNHYHVFADACLGGEKTESHFAQTGPMTEAILLGTVALRVPGQKLLWDHARMRITNNREAQRLLQRKYRDGWGVAGF